MPLVVNDVIRSQPVLMERVNASVVNAESKKFNVKITRRSSRCMYNPVIALATSSLPFRRKKEGLFKSDV